MEIKELKEKLFIAVVRYNALISLILVIVILAGGYFLILSPYYQKTKKKYLDSKTYNETLYESKKNTLEKIVSILSDYNNIKDIDKEKIDKILPSSREHVDLFPEIEFITLRNGLLLHSIGIDEITDFAASLDAEAPVKAKLENVGAFRISVSVSGAKYDNFKKYLDSIEKNLRLMDILSMNFDPKGGTASLELLTYYWKE